MNRIVKIAKSSFHPAAGCSLRKHVTRGICALASALSLLFVATSAHAACGNFSGVNAKGPVKLPLIEQVPSAFNNFGSAPATIVGLWHVIYTNSADDSTFNDTFDTWHDDGTEFETAFLPPAGGDVCVGVWKQTGPRSVTLHHVGWLFDASTPAATATNYFTLDEMVSVSPNGLAYSGNFTFKVWNLNGSPTPVEVTGTIAATRIAVN
jgi:hypothetical protein